MADDASALLDSIDPSKGSTAFEGMAPPSAPKMSSQDQADQMLDSIDPRVSGWGAPKGSEQPNGSSALGAFGRAAERSALPTAGGLAGAASGASAGAEIGAVGGPVGALAGGLIGGIGGSMLGAGAVDALQGWAVSKLPAGAQKWLGGTEDEQKQDFDGHPFASILGGVAPFLLTANPGIAARETAEGASGLAKLMSNKYAAAGFSGLTMGGITLGQEVVQGQKPDWTEIGINTALGTFWSKPNALGERIMGGAELAGARVGQRITGRVPTPETVTLADGGDQKVGPAPGVTEDVATGQAEMAPAAEAQVRDAARTEQTLTGPPPVTNPVEHARSLHPELFNQYDAVQARIKDLQSLKETMSLGPAMDRNIQAAQEEATGLESQIKNAIAGVAESKGALIPEDVAGAEPQSDTRTPDMDAISDHVIQQLKATGASDEYSQAAGDLVAARYARRAALLGENPNDMYEREGAVIVGPGRKRNVIPPHPADALADVIGNTGGPSPDEQQTEPELNQSAHGKIRWQGENPQATITLGLGHPANETTFVHEQGHDFLEQMARDVTHDRAPDQLKSDWQGALKWMGLSDEEFRTRGPRNTLPAKAVRAHEKFAQGFERYMSLGVAPNEGLAHVFARFASWMREAFRAIIKGGALTPGEIPNEMKGIYGRLFDESPKHISVGEWKEHGPGLHEIHEADAAETPPQGAVAAADRIMAETERAKADLPTEIRAEHERGRQEIEAERAAAAGIEPTAEDGTGEPGSGSASRPGEQEGNEPGGSAGGEQSGAELSGGRAALSKGNGAGAERKPIGASPGDSIFPKPVERFPEPESGLVDKAGNVRLDNLVLPEQLGEVLMESAARNDDFKSVRGSMTKGEMMDLASDLGMKPDDDGLEANLAKITGKFDNLAKYALALRLLVRQSSQAVYEAATLSAREGTDESVAALAQAITRHDMIQSTLSGATANWGRSGSAFHNLSSFKGGGLELDRVLRENTGRTLFQLKLIGRMISGADATPTQVSAIIRDSGKYSFGEMLLEYWVNGLISGPITHATYAIGNSIIAANKIFLETPVAAAISAMRSRDGTNVIPFGEAAAQLRGAGKGLLPGLHAASEAMRTGVTTALPGESTVQALGPLQQAGVPATLASMLKEDANFHDVMESWHGIARGLKDAWLVAGAIDKAKTPAIGLEYSTRGVIPNIIIGGRAKIPVGDLARLPGRGVATIHSFFRAVGYSTEINGQEYRQAYNEGYRGDVLPQRIADMRLQRTPEQMEIARNEASEQTLMAAGGKFTQMLSRFTNSAVKLPLLGETRILKFVDPFVSISSAIINQALIKRTPLGFLAPTMRADIMGTNGPIAADRALSRMLVGSSLAVTAGVLAAEGYLSGAGPQDPKQMATWRLAGNQPHSVKLNDTWYDLHRLGPLGMLLGMSADLYDVAHTATHDDLMTAGGQLMHAIAQNVLDESFMRGPAELLKAIDDKSYAENQYIPNFVSSFVPYSVGMSQVARTMDPYSRLTHGTIDAIKAKVPGYSQELQPRRDIWGQPVSNRQGAGELTAIWEQKQSTDPTNLAMLRLGIGKPLPPRSLSNIKLTDQQYDDFSRIAGVMTKQRMDQYVRSSMFQHQTDGEKREAVDGIFKACRESARGVMFMKYPSIPAQATALRKSRATGADIREIGE